MSISWKFATREDAATLAEWNYILIRDEGHRNPMTVSQLRDRMRDWLQREYTAIILNVGNDPLGYALYRRDEDSLHLRQFFIRPEHRRRGYGRAGMRLLREEVWPKDLRLTVDVLCRNEAGVAFWRAMGYRDYCLTLELIPNENIT